MLLCTCGPLLLHPPSYTHTLSLSLSIYLTTQQIRTVNKRCLTCDCELSFYGPKPTICGKDLCVFQYENLGLGLSLVTEVSRNGAVLDLLISLLW